MATRYFFASLTRISNLPDTRFSVARLPKSQWATGDYVVGEVTPHHRGLSSVELVEKLSGMKALDLLDKRALPALRAILQETLGF